ncbi:MAG: hypothetical protein IT580_02645 [Verrucomicrobiales bacterium]|nr:hypothetical protein [Verrucomicrobiales bacterium]
MKKPGGPRKPWRDKLEGSFGGHEFALEHLVVGYALEGYNAATIRRKLKQDHPDVFVEGINENSILWLLRRAMDCGVVSFNAPRLRELGDQLHEFYEKKFRRLVRFTVADDTICFRHARSITPFFWSVAADAIADCIEQVLVEEESAADANAGGPRRVVVGNTGGPAVSESIKPLIRRGIDPNFLDAHRERLWFLSLTSAGSARHFDCHSNYLAALLGQIYRANHIAVVNNGSDEADAREYGEVLRDLKLLIGGVGGRSGYLLNWCREHSVPIPAGMIGDVFFSPIDSSGQLLSFSPEAERLLAPLRLRPTRSELNEFSLREDKRALVIATESRGGAGQPAPDKSQILDRVIRAGHVTDCVLGGGLAKRLLLLHRLRPKD